MEIKPPIAEHRPQSELGNRWFFYVANRTIILSFLVFIFSNTFAQSLNKHALVMLNGEDGIEKLTSNNDIHIIKCLSKLYHIYMVEPNAPSDLEQFIIALKKRPEVVIAQLNHKVFLRGIPNDTFFNKQWHLQNTASPTIHIGAVNVWDSTTGGITKTGDTIVLGLVELGLEITHPDLQQNLFINHPEIPNNQIDDDSNGYVDDYHGYNTVLGNDSIPPSGHGTSVAGVMGAVGNNKIGVSGINWNVKILPVAFPTADEASVIEAYSYYAQMKKYYIQSQGKKGAFVVSVNSSFGIDNGNPKDYPLWCAMYDSLGQLGIVSVAATANSAINTDVSLDMPTSCLSHFLVMVTNHDVTGVINNTAAFGKRNIDIAAPGTDIYTTGSNGNYNFDGGTSFAAPQVTGGIGLLYSAACPATINWVKNNPAYGALFFKSIVMNGAKRDNNFSSLTQCGGGLYLPSAFDLLKTGFCGIDSFPLAAIYFNQTQICPRELTQLICLKNDYIKTVSWFVNGIPAGNTDTITWQNDTAGYYDIKLVVANNLLTDTLELKKYIRVLNLPQKPVIQVNTSYLTTQNAVVNWYDTAGTLLGTGVNYTPIQKGRYYCAYTNPDLCTSTADAVNFYGVGISSTFENGTIEIYPNPVSQDLYIENKISNTIQSDNLTIEIFDPMGGLILEKKVFLTKGSKELIPFSNFSAGLYLVRVSDMNGDIWVQKIVKN